MRPLGSVVRRCLALVGLATLLSGCSTVSYYWQSVNGHLQLINAARPVEEVLAEPATAEPLRERLRLAVRIRDFASTELHLPEGASYRRYADLHRRAVVWNVVAAPEFSLQPMTWCFPIVGCVGYRGYFAEADAQQFAADLRQQGLEVSVYGVPAYSTLGWMNWAGGDPLLNTFIHYPEGELARMIFHELAHQVLYVSGDTMFNESFATAVERLGSARWLAMRGSPQARAEYAEFDARRQAFRSLTGRTRQALAGVYAAPGNANLSSHKRRIMEEFRARYADMAQQWGAGPAQRAGYDRWVAQANNASFAAQAAYDDLVPGFEALFEREGRDWARFYDAVRQLAQLPLAQRHEALGGRQ